MTAFVIALNVLLRNKYVTYVVATGTGAGLIYLYNLGYNHWLYNPLYRLWKYTDLTTGPPTRAGVTASHSPPRFSRSLTSYSSANLNSSINFRVDIILAFRVRNRNPVVRRT